MLHKHHITPKHMGGSDDAENLIELCVEDHAYAHVLLYMQYGCWEDKVAFEGLFGLVDNPAAEAGKNALARFRATNSYEGINLKGAAAQREKSRKPVVYKGVVYEAIQDLRKEFKMGWYKFNRLVREGEITYY